MPNNDVFNFTQGIDKNFADIVNRLVEIIDRSGYGLDTGIKWKKLTLAKNNDFHHWICAISVTKKCVTLSFHYGGLLDDPNKILISGESKFFRKLEYRRISDIDETALIDFIGQAVSKLDYFKDNWKNIQSGELNG